MRSRWPASRLFTTATLADFLAEQGVKTAFIGFVSLGVFEYPDAETLGRALLAVAGLAAIAGPAREQELKAAIDGLAPYRKSNWPPSASSRESSSSAQISSPPPNLSNNATQRAPLVATMDAMRPTSSWNDSQGVSSVPRSVRRADLTEPRAPGRPRNPRSPRTPQSEAVGRLDVAGRVIAYRRAGSGPPLVLLHGFLCDSRVWRRQLAELADEFDVVAWDAPGAGLSPDPPAGFGLADWAICLAGFLEALGLGPAHIVGLSWGGLLAQELFRFAPERIRTLVLADTYAGWKGSFGDEVARQRLARCERESSLPADEFVRVWVPVEFFTENVTPDVVEEMAAVVRDFHPSGFRLMARSLAKTDTSELLPDIDVPTLLVGGDGDRRSPLEVAAAFGAAIPRAQLQVIANAGHVSNMERPEEFNAHVRRFARANQRPQLGGPQPHQ